MSGLGEATDDQVSLVLFDVGGARYAADLTQVIRLDFFDAAYSVGEPLGPPQDGTKCLMIDAQDGLEWCLAIDTLHGVRTVPIEDLRRLPPLAQGGKVSIGAWLDGKETILLVDLVAMTMREGADH